MQDTTTTYLYICNNKRVVCTTKNFDPTVVKYRKHRNYLVQFLLAVEFLPSHIAKVRQLTEQEYHGLMQSNRRGLVFPKNEQFYLFASFSLFSWFQLQKSSTMTSFLFCPPLIMTSVQLLTFY